MRRLAVLGLLVLALASTSCSSDAGVTAVQAEPIGGAGTTGASGDSLDWIGCEDSTAQMVDLQCATLRVPRDYDDPDGATIEIALARARTAGSERIGSLLFNPGGPGGSGIEFLTSVATVVPPDLSQRFDLVSFDPRGVGDSSAIDCTVDFDDDVSLLQPGDDAGWQALVDEAESQSDTCTADSLELAPFVGTNNAARDLDEIRAALGDDQLSYVGFSYGTRLGATYAELFPDRVRALVLDGAVKPTDDQALLGAEQGPGFDAALESFAVACDADTDCPLTELGPTLELYQGLVDEIADVGSFPTDQGDRILTPGELQLGVIASLYSTQLWPVLAQALYVADTEQDGSLLQVLADSYTGRRPDGTYDNSQPAGSAINCADDPSRPAPAEVRRLAEDAAGRSTYFGDFLRASTGCLGSPDPIDPIVIGPADGAPPILVIGNTGDPATPYAWSQEMADVLSSGVLYTVEAEGHTAFLSVPCVEQVVVDYLVDLDVPDAGSSCEGEPSADVFLPAGEGEFDQVLALFDCLRDQGLDIPEIDLGDLLADPNGEELFDAIDPSDPAVVRAALACQDLIPDL